ncbi:MAG: tyrosine-type recombinase/integrase [Parashewanella sp.]
MQDSDSNQLKALFEELSDFSEADSLKSHQRNEDNEIVKGFIEAESEARHSLQDGGGHIDLSNDWSIDTTLPTDLNALRDFERLFKLMMQAQSERALNGVSERFEGLYNKAKKLSDTTHKEKQPSYLLSQAWADFLQYKESWSHKQKTQNIRYFNIMVEYFGDIEVTSITKPKIKSLLSRYQDFPKGNIKPYHKMTISEIMALDESEIAPEDKIRPKLVKDLLKLCQSFFSVFLTEKKELFEYAPTKGIKYGAKSTSYACFNDSQIKRIKEKALTYYDWRKWAVLLAIYTGARRGDILGLTNNCIKRDEDTDRYYIWISKGKTDAATRAIPIHNKLVEFGFIKFAQSQQGYLFGEYAHKPNRFTDLIHHFKEELEIPECDIKGQRYSLHSFRHTFITKVQSKGVRTALFQSVVGHEKTGLGISKRYTHDFAVKDLFVVVDAIDDW